MLAKNWREERWRRVWPRVWPLSGWCSACSAIGAEPGAGRSRPRQPDALGDVIEEIRVEGNQRIEARDDPQLHGWSTIGDPFDPARARPVAQEPVRDRPVRRRGAAAARATRWSSAWSRTRSSTASPSRATAASTTRLLQQRGPAAAARGLHPLAGAERRSAASSSSTAATAASPRRSSPRSSSSSRTASTWCSRSTRGR